MRLANQILDAYDALDANMNEELVKIAKVQPDLYIKDDAERAALTDNDYALNVITKEAQKMGKFPIASAEDTFLSNIFFEKNAHKLPREAAQIAAYHIKTACDKFKIKPTKKVATMSKKANHNLYVESEGDLRPVRVQKTASMGEMVEAEKIASNYTFAQYAFPTPKHVELGGKYFEKFASKMPLEIRHGYAESLQKRASELGMNELKGEVAKYASDHYSAMVGAHIRHRGSLLDGKDPKFAATLSKLAAARQSFAPAEFAKALHSFDKHAGLTKYYGGTISDPYISTFGQMPADMKGQIVKTASGKTMSSDALQQLATAKYDRIKEYFGKNVADEFKSSPTEIFESLPMDSKEIIIGIADGTL